MNVERREQWVDTVAKEMGGPLTALDIAKMLKDPNSILNKALAGFVTTVEQMKMVAQFTVILNLIIALRKEIMSRVSEVVATASDSDFSPRTSDSEKGPLFSQVSIVFPESIKQLETEIKGLQVDSQKLRTDLATSQTKQRDDFYEDVKKMEPELKERLNFTVMTFEKQKEFAAIYEDRVKGVDEILKVSKGALTESDRGTLEKSVGYKAELLMVADMLKRDGDENLKPTEVSALSKAVLGKYVKKQGEHHKLAQDIKAVEQKMAMKMEKLVEETKEFVQHYKIPKAPPPPAPHPRLTL
ncbi:MAG TPA: hypothetical protein VGV92_00535 [Gammaproteobacteria bacterium]|nr:hypothetical protein [Gammaproteobacteria bacterium]